MKNIIAEKTIIIGSMLLSLFIISDGDTVIQHNDTTKTTITQKDIKNGLVFKDAIKLNEKNLNIDSIIAEAKASVDEYNKSVNEKNRITKKQIEVIKKNIDNTKRINLLTKALIKKINKNNVYNSNDNTTISDLKIDTVCIKYRKPLFAKEKCVEALVEHYIYKGKEKITLQITQIHK